MSARNTKAAAPADTKATPAAAAPAPQTCRCGCNQQVAARRLYRPGHDARHAGVAARAGADAIAQLPTPALQAKATALAARWQAAAEEKAAKATARAEAAAAKAAEATAAAK